MRNIHFRWLLVSVLVITLGLWTAGAALAQVRLTILGGIIGGGPYLQAAGLGQIMSEHMGGVAQGTVQATPGLGANALRLANGLGDLAVVVSTARDGRNGQSAGCAG